MAFFACSLLSPGKPTPQSQSIRAAVLGLPKSLRAVVEEQQYLLLQTGYTDMLLLSSSSVWVPEMVALQLVSPSVYLLPENWGRGKICGTSMGSFVNSFCVNCSIMLMELLGSLLESPGVLLEMFRKSFSRN